MSGGTIRKIIVFPSGPIDLYSYKLGNMAKNVSKKTNRPDMKNMAEILKAIAHPDRLAILALLCENKSDGLSVKNIYEKLSLQQPVTSRHLNILKGAGVVRRLQEGQKISYCLCMEKKNVESLSRCFC